MRAQIPRWLQRPKAPDETPGVDLDSMSEAKLESLYAVLVRIAALPPKCADARTAPDHRVAREPVLDLPAASTEGW